jgi:predicted exporter
MLTSVCGFASLLPSAFPSLAQLGLYTIAGLAAAALVTRFVLPGLLPKRTVLAAPGLATRSFTRLVAALQRARHVLWPLALLAIVVLLIHRDRLWSHELSALSPVSAADQRRDADLRADLGAADVSELVVVAGPDMDQVLKVSEQVTGKLDELIARNDIAGYESPSRYLPSQSTQRARLDSLPEESALRARVAVAAHAAGLRASRLEPFIADVIAAHDGPLLGPHDLEGTAMASGLDSLLVRLGDDWTALLPLRSTRQGGAGRDIDPVRIEKAVAPLSSAGIRVEALNLKQEADSLYETYLHSAMRLCCAGLAAIALLLCIALRSFARAARVLLPLAVAALCVAAGFALSHRPMNLLHLVGLLLIFAVGSNYALFFDRGSMSSGHFVHPRTLGSLLLANLTTTIAFGVLATSGVPVLSALGSTVAPGAVLALLCSAVLAGGTARAAPAEADGR